MRRGRTLQPPAPSTGERRLPPLPAILAVLAAAGLVAGTAFHIRANAAHPINIDEARSMTVAIPADMDSWDKFSAVHRFPDGSMGRAIKDCNGDTMPVGAVVIPLDTATGTIPACR